MNGYQRKRDRDRETHKDRDRDRDSGTSCIIPFIGILKRSRSFAMRYMQLMLVEINSHA
jgi:hypothetical protein